jgi:diaminohydroxyphosphoribosylaminopyrimidine deaminase / 5-amino-6-(5-phosphoribosylamino)uracil reductase
VCSWWWPLRQCDYDIGTVVRPEAALTGQDDARWMRLAVELAWLCPPSDTAYSVGAVIVAADGTELSRGFSRESDPVVHAEESALGKLGPGDPRLPGATIYSTLEPCSQRKSRPRSCTELIIASGIRRVVIAWREPSLFVADCHGYELLEQAGLEVTELPAFSEQAAAPNRHLKFLSSERTRGLWRHARIIHPSCVTPTEMRHYAKLVTSW